MVKKKNLNKNQFLISINNYLKDKRFEKIIYWKSDNSFIIEDLSELTKEGSSFKSEEVFNRNILEYNFDKKKDGEKLVFTHNEFKRGIGDDKIRLIKKRKKKKGKNFHKIIKQRLISKLNEEKKYLELPKEIDELKNFKKEVITNKLNKLILLKRKSDAEEILKNLKNMTIKEVNNQSNNNNVQNVSIYVLYNNYYNNVQSSGIGTFYYNLDRYKSTGSGEPMGGFDFNSINNETEETTF